MNQLAQITSMAIFAKVVDTMSYTEAARAIGVSKSAVSKELARLEAVLGVSLLKRTTRKIEVTDVGHTYYKYCARMLTEVQSADAFMDKYHADPVGNLRVVSPVTFGNRVIVPLLNQFAAKYVNVQVELELTDRQIDPEEANIDVAIFINRVKPEPGLGRTLMEIEWGLFASPAYLERHPAISDPDQLGRHLFLLFRGSAHTTVVAMRKHKREVEVRVRCIMRSNNSVALLNGALDDLGVAYLPRYVAREAVEEKTLIPIFPDWTFEKRFAYVAYREDALVPPRVLSFVQYLTENFEQT
ncbi:LysR family transcriptional regulator [Paraherbaspirillum soli]|uniref:LysR family transcriptional regulator n=1 Tax=Paraherbaspirillum soli TaxID=631222 RepID=A0ABW0M8J5_9BURK